MTDFSDNRFEYVVPEAESGCRLDQFLSSVNDQHSRSFFQKLIKNNHVLLNDFPAKSSARLAEGDEVSVQIPAPEKWHLAAENIPLDIVYEDDHLLVVNKPAGMVVHPGAGAKSATLANGLLHHCGELSTIGGIIRPGIVHRLDKNTSGLLVVAKTDQSHIFLQNQFKERSISRTYQALVWGHLKEASGVIKGNIARSAADRKKMTVVDAGKEAATFYRVLASYTFASLLELKLATGRTHQIRVHMKYARHPVVGDPEYNGRDSQVTGLKGEHQRLARQLLSKLPHQFLHAFHLQFIHPETKKTVEFSAPLPGNLQQVLDFLQVNM